MHLRKKKNRKLSDEEILFLKMAAYDALIQLGEHSLPVITDYIYLAKTHKLFILPMQSLAINLGFDVSSFITLPDGCISNGFIMYVEATNNYLIAYNETLPPEERRWFVAKLIAYMKLGIPNRHPGTYCHIDCGKEDDYSDIKSEQFAYYYTCPDVILNECNIKEPSDIITYCQIPFVNANKKSNLLESTKSILTFSQIEEILKNNFQKFIDYIKIK